MDSRVKIIYVYDALCGWCYGFGPVISKLYYKYRNLMDFEVISGGMVVGSQVGPIAIAGAYISNEYKKVEQTCGVKFGEKFLNGILKPGASIFSSEKPAIAMAVFRELFPKRTVEFAAVLQRALFIEGSEPENLTAYGKYAGEFGADAAVFTENMKKETFLKQAYAEFELARQLGALSFPTLFLKTAEKMYVLTRGYQHFDSIDKVFSKVKTQL